MSYNDKKSSTSFWHNWYSNIFDTDADKRSTHIVLACLVMAAIAGAAYYSYTWYTNKKNNAAHTLFASNMEEFERVMQDGTSEDWASVQTLFKLGYNQYPNSSLAPYFLLFQAEAMLKQQDVDQALATFTKAIDMMPKDSPVLGFYKTKRALIQLDHQDTALHNQALESLQQIARDSGNHAQDLAAYNLGLYYWMNNNKQQAKEVWDSLIESTRTTEKNGQSPWAAKAQAMLGSQTREIEETQE